MQHRHLTVLLAAAAMAWSVAIQADTDSAVKYPPASRVSTIDDYHGIKVADP
jgi:hypothetical protein